MSGLIERLLRGKLEPEKVKAAPLSMDSYKWLYVLYALTTCVSL
jgi:hypothetical protein